VLGRRALAAGALAATLAPPPSPTPLRSIARSRGILFGSEITAAEIERDPAYADLVARECAIVTPGIEAKWGIVQPQEERFDFAPLDRVLGFARAHGLRLHMHTLVWAVGMPPWLTGALAEGRGDAVLRRHAAMLVPRARGLAAYWDAVNEPVDPRWPADTDGLCTTPWRRGLGPGFVADAFAAVRAQDPSACLMINDDDLEYAGADRDRKRAQYLRLIERWLRAGVPIGGFGLEAHLKPWLTVAEQPYRRFLRDLAGMGLTLAVTELDVCDRTLPADPGLRDRASAALCRRYLDLVLDEPALRLVQCWGLSDRTSWMRRDPAAARPDGLAPRPCPYDAQLRAKPMRQAIADALAAAPERQPAPS
jgi:endo-1,4-beta-xylanase